MNRYWRKRLTRKRAIALLSYDPKTGIMRWRNNRKGPANKGDEAGSIRHGYRIITVDGYDYRSGRLIWLIMTGKWPRQYVDHINGIKNDDRWKNLREANNSQNSKNRGLDKRNKLGITGVFYEVRKQRNPRFTAYVSIAGKQRRIGMFKKLEEAIACRLAAERKYYGEWRRI